MRTPDRLYDLLPPVFRQYDPANGYPLRALMQLAQSQIELLEDDMARLYDDWFIETCALDIIPHIAALVGMEQAVLRQVLLPEHHAWVGNAIAYRRRKGVVGVLQPLIRSATGWYARAAEQGTTTAVDIDVWRLMPFPFAAATPGIPSRDADGRRFTFHPLGLDTQLFNQPLLPLPRTAQAPGWYLPVPLTRERLEADPEPGVNTNYYGFEKALALICYSGGVPAVIPAADVRVADLRQWRTPPGNAAAYIDPELGRILLGNVACERLLVSYSNAFSAEIGGGTYPRGERIVRAGAEQPMWHRTVGGGDPESALQTAIAEWANGTPERAVIELTDNRTWQAAMPPLHLGGRSLTIRAANEVRPCVLFDGPVSVMADAPGTFALNGLLVQGTVSVAASTDFFVDVDDCTLVPPYAMVYAFRETGHLRWRRYAHTATPLRDDAQVLVAGGAVTGPDTALATAEIYDARLGEWKTICPLNVARSRHAATQWQRRSYVFGGRGSDGEALDSIECYDDTGTFHLLRCRLRYARWSHTVTLLPHGHVLIAGGRNERGPVPYYEIFDPIHEHVWVGGPMARPRWGHAAASVPCSRDILLYGGRGENDRPVEDPELYDSVSNRARAIEPPRDAPAVDRPIAITIAGEVLIAGGRTEDGAATRAALRYSAGFAGGFHRVGPLHSGRWGHTATLLHDGRVAIIGGEGTHHLIAHAELYDPHTRSFTRIAALHVPRRDHTSTILSSGRVLVTGGRGPDLCPLSDSELLTREQSHFEDQNVLEVRPAETSETSDTGVSVKVGVRRSIVGPIHFAAPATLIVADSILEPFERRRWRARSLTRDRGVKVDATLQQCTVFGSADVTRFALASNVLFMGRTRVEDGKGTCARYSWVPLRAAKWGNTYRCQPLLRIDEVAAEHGVEPWQLPRWLVRLIALRLRPQFTSRHFGDAAFAQLAANCDPAISAGGSSGSEMGAFHLLDQPQRRALLEEVVDDFLPLGGTRTIDIET